MLRLNLDLDSTSSQVSPTSPTLLNAARLRGYEKDGSISPCARDLCFSPVKQQRPEVRSGLRGLLFGNGHIDQAGAPWLRAGAAAKKGCQFVSSITQHAWSLFRGALSPCGAMALLIYRRLVFVFWLGGHFDYSTLNKELDFLMYIDVKSEDAEGWKLESTKSDCEENNGNWLRQKRRYLANNEMWIRPFHDRYEKPLAEDIHTNMVLRMDAARRIVGVDFRDREDRKLDIPRQELCNEVLDRIFASKSLAKVFRSRGNPQLQADLRNVYIPIGEELLRRVERSGSGDAFVVGINAPPGTGKSTLVKMFEHVLGACAMERGWTRIPRIAVISSDDLYMGVKARFEAGVTTRLDPCSLDEEYLSVVSKLKKAKQNDIVEVPRFGKGLADGKGDRLPSERLKGPFDIVFVEGWRVGVQPGALWVPRMSLVRMIKYGCWF